jgi:signal transduction histidine kinase
VRDAAGVAHLAAAAPAASGPARALRAGGQGQPDVFGAYAGRFAATGAVASAAIVTDAPPAAPFNAAGIAATTTVRVAGPGLADALLLVGYGAERATTSGEQADHLMIVAALLEAARAVRASHRREAVLRDQLEQSALAGRELAHQLNNDLTMPVGIIELLLDRATVAPDLREMIQAAAQDLAVLEGHIRAFHASMRSLSRAVEGAAVTAGTPVRPSPRP